MDSNTESQEDQLVFFLEDLMGSAQEDQEHVPDSVPGSPRGSAPEEQKHKPESVPAELVGSTPEEQKRLTESVPREPVGSTLEEQKHLTESVPGEPVGSTLEEQKHLTESVPGGPRSSAPEEKQESIPGKLAESFPGDPMESALQDQLEDQMDSVPGDPKIFNFGDLEKTMEEVITSLCNGDRKSLITFLSTYPAHTTMQQVLDVLFTRYGIVTPQVTSFLISSRYASFHPGCQEDEDIKDAICTLLDTWTSVFPEDFAKPSGVSALERMKRYLIIHLPYSDTLIQVYDLLTSLLSKMEEESY
ncbi:Ral guanine nucleotide dissociation stimulator [Lemmus lemmus]